MTADAAEGRENEERRRERATALALSAWELEKTRAARPDTPRARAVLLRSYQRLRAELEERQGVPPEKRSIVLAGAGAKDSVLLIHGATGTPSEMRPLADFLAGAGYNVYCPLMPGHAKIGPGLHEVLWRACLQESRLRYQLLRQVSRRVHVVGLSFGAALAIHLAHEELPYSLVLLAPALEPRLTLGARLMLRLGVHRLQWVRRRYGWSLQILEAMEKARPLLAHVAAPVYAAHCADDATISPGSLRLLQKKTHNPASRFRLFPTGGHLILQAHGEATLHGEILRFLQET
jgi:carboxylesterase